MIEKTVLDYLSAKLIAPVYMETPEKIPSTYILVEKTGGGCENYIYRATLAIQSIAPTLYEAAELNEAAKSAMFCITDTENVSRCELNSDYNFTNSDTKQYRYQAVFDLWY